MVLKKKEALLEVMKGDYIPGIVSKILVSAGFIQSVRDRNQG